MAKISLILSSDIPAFISDDTKGQFYLSLPLPGIQTAVYINFNDKLNECNQIPSLKLAHFQFLLKNTMETENTSLSLDWTMPFSCIQKEQYILDTYAGKQLS